MASKNLNLKQAINLIQVTRADRLGGLFETTDAKMKELGVEPNRRLARAGEGADSNHSVKGILDWVNCLCAPAALDDDATDDHKAAYDEAVKEFEADKVTLATLHATLLGRLRASGHEVNVAPISQ